MVHPRAGCARSGTRAEDIQLHWQDQISRVSRAPLLVTLLNNSRVPLHTRFEDTYRHLQCLSRQRRRFLLRKLGTSVAGAAMVLAILNTPHAHAATINVAGACTLVGAIEAANTDAAVNGCSAGSGADTITLNGTTQQLFNSINGAVNAPFSGLPVITSNITIDGGSGAAAVIERPSSVSDAFRLIEVSSSGDLTLNNVVLRGGEAGGGYGFYSGAGGAILNDGGVVNVNNSVVEGNNAYSLGGGIASASGGTTIVSTTKVTENHAGEGSAGSAYGGGLSVSGGAELILDETTVTNNVAADLTGNSIEGGGGGGIAVGNGELSVRRSEISNNSSSSLYSVGYGGGIWSSLDATTTVVESIISGNSGGGLFANEYSVVSIIDSRVENNTRENYSGGGLYSGGGISFYGNGTEVNLSRSTVSGNQASYGAGISVGAGSTLTVTDNSSIENNTAVSTYGGDSTKGGGIIVRHYNSYYASTVTITDSSITGNIAARGGGIHSEGDLDISVERSTISGNVAGEAGGGIYANTGSDLTLINSTISGNTVSQTEEYSSAKGGGMHINGGNLKLIFSTVSGNTANASGANQQNNPNSTGVYSYGGGVSVEGSLVLLEGSLLVGNTAIATTGVSAGFELSSTGSILDSLAPNLFGHNGLTTSEAVHGFTPAVGIDVTASSDGTIPTQLSAILNPSLANNGGPTQTHVLATGSPAVDAAGLQIAPLIDQRGVARPQGAGFDIGAVEGAGTLCNGLSVTVDIGNGDFPTLGDDVIMGTAGDDVIFAMEGNDTICGVAGDDAINAGPGDDWVNAGMGADSVFGLDGSDVLHGGSGIDQIVAGNDDDLIYGDDGDDTLNGGPGNDIVYGGNGDDALFGQGGDDMLFGGAGNDFAVGVTGSDEIHGGGGDDSLNGGPGNDTVIGGDGNDLIFGLTGNDTLDGGLADDRVFGQLGDDVITGGTGDDELFGNQGNDVISVTSGTNVINGGPDNDTLTGGVGDDQIFGDGDLQQAGNDVIDGDGGADLLIGFAGDDTITSDDGIADTVNGGPGADVCTADGVDTVFNCP